jgi:hypothetical protein
MTKRITLLLLLIGLASSGCVSTRWVRDGATMQDFASDRYKCVQESRTSYSAWGRPGYVLAAQLSAQIQAEQLFALCMQASGWRAEVDR